MLLRAVLWCVTKWEWFWRLPDSLPILSLKTFALYTTLFRSFVVVLRYLSSADACGMTAADASGSSDFDISIFRLRPGVWRGAVDGRGDERQVPQSAKWSSPPSSAATAAASATAQCTLQGRRSSRVGGAVAASRSSPCWVAAAAAAAVISGRRYGRWQRWWLVGGWRRMRRPSYHDVNIDCHDDRLSSCGRWGRAT